jgi:hypothetical protein
MNNYRDVTHADFKTKRSTNPLEPTYVVRNDDGTLMTIGKIENSNTLHHPERKRGPVSSSLATNDIEGAQTGTKGLGVFAHHKRSEVKQINKIDDIAGSTVGSLRKGVATNRISNPLSPEYTMPGATEYKENSAFGMTGQQVMGGAKAPTLQQHKQTKPPFKMPHNINRERFKRDINTFYDTEDRNFADIDFNKLYKATKDPNAGNSAPQIPENVQKDVHFKHNEKLFYNQSQTEGSEFEYNQHRFYEDTTGDRRNDTNPNAFKNLGQGPKPERKTEVPKNHQHFKKDQAHFYGQSYVPSDKSSDRGSIFQNNAAEFYGMEKPAHGEKPFQISSKNLEDPRKQQQNKGSVLNEMRLKEHERNMERDPKFGKNLRKFWGMKSVGTNSNYSNGGQSYAQQLGGMIGR